MSKFKVTGLYESQVKYIEEFIAHNSKISQEVLDQVNDDIIKMATGMDDKDTIKLQKNEK